MGSNYSKIKKALEKGDEHKVLEIYKKSPDIRKKLNANAIINDYTLDTYMHYAAKMGMLEFLKLLLNENNGNPNKQNKRKQTVLHKVCEGVKDQVQFECMKLLFQWRENNTKNTNNKSIMDSTSDHIIDKSCDIDVNAKDDVIILKYFFISFYFRQIYLTHIKRVLILI
jgi:ankyrin repeat protein